MTTCASGSRMMGDVWTKESYYEPEEFTAAGGLRCSSPFVPPRLGAG